MPLGTEGSCHNCKLYGECGKPACSGWKEAGACGVCPAEVSQPRQTSRGLGTVKSYRSPPPRPCKWNHRGEIQMLSPQNLPCWVMRLFCGLLVAGVMCFFGLFGLLGLFGCYDPVWHCQCPQVFIWILPLCLELTNFLVLPSWLGLWYTTLLLKNWVPWCLTTCLVLSHFLVLYCMWYPSKLLICIFPLRSTHTHVIWVPTMFQLAGFLWWTKNYYFLSLEILKFSN